MAKRAVVAMGGGPTRVINRTLFGIVDEATRHRIDVLGALHGLDGVLKDKFIPLTPGTEPVSVAKDWPGAMIGSTRRKPKAADCAAAFEVLKKRDVRFLFYIGGNDTSEACMIINQDAKKAGYELRTFHVPKTIDNDLVLNDHCPGYGSAARYVANAVLGDDLDTQSLPGLKIDIVMGRNAGWLTAATALGRGKPGDAPHVVYLCERTKSVADLTRDAIALYQRQKRGVIAVSEGLCGPDGEEFISSSAIRAELARPPYESVLKFLAASDEMMKATGAKADEFGHIQLSGTGMLADAIAAIVKLALMYEAGVESPRVRADTFGYAQRAHAGEVSPVDAAEAEMVGRDAIKFALAGDVDGTIMLKATREGGKYDAYTEVGPLEHVGGKVRTVPDDFINAAGNDVTPAFMDYGLPLVGPMPRTWSA